MNTPTTEHGMKRGMDIAFLVEMKERLARARAGDWTEADMIERMIDDWIDELTHD